MPPNDLVWQCFLPLESIRLGRFIINTEEPHQDYGLLRPGLSFGPQDPQKASIALSRSAK